MLRYYGQRQRAGGSSLGGICTTAASRIDGCGDRSVAETVRRRLQLLDRTSVEPSVRRRRPVMWCSSSNYSATSAFGTKRHPCHHDDNEEDNSDDKDDVGILPVALPPQRPRKKRRRVVSPYLSPHQASSLSPLWDPYNPALLRRKRMVKFADPIVTEVQIRPRTLPEDVEQLFYRKADKTRFLREIKEERRLKSLGKWESDEED